MKMNTKDILNMLTMTTNGDENDTYLDVEGEYDYGVDVDEAVDEICRTCCYP